MGNSLSVSFSIRNLIKLAFSPGKLDSRLTQWSVTVSLWNSLQQQLVYISFPFNWVSGMMSCKICMQPPRNKFEWWPWLWLWLWLSSSSIALLTIRVCVKCYLGAGTPSVFVNAEREIPINISKTEPFPSYFSGREPYHQLACVSCGCGRGSVTGN